MKAVIVLSGGMDSTTALAWAKNDPRVEVAGVLHFQYGSKHNRQELMAVEKIAEHYAVKLEVVHLADVARLFKSDLLNTGEAVPEGHYADESMKKTVVPFRNGIMLAIAAGYAESIGADMVVLGSHQGDHAIYPDCRVEFIGAMSHAIGLGTYAEIKTATPFQFADKTEIARTGHKLAVPFELTYTCYKGGEKHCGKCGSCTERREAFQLANVPDPTVYE
jgi:7-cyano-7-deazaguanine synthase